MWYCYDAGSAKRTNAARHAAPEDCMDTWTSAERRTIRVGFWAGFVLEQLSEATRKRQYSWAAREIGGIGLCDEPSLAWPRGAGQVLVATRSRDLAILVKGGIEWGSATYLRRYKYYGPRRDRLARGPELGPINVASMAPVEAPPRHRADAATGPAPRVLDGRDR